MRQSKAGHFFMITLIQEQRMMLRSPPTLLIPEIKTAAASIYLRAIMAMIKQSD